MRRLFLTAIFLAMFAAVRADVAQDARALIDAGDTPAAREILAAALSEPQKPAATATLNVLLAECLALEGDYAGARPLLEKYKGKAQPAAYRWLGYLDFLDYRYADATRNYAEYSRLMKLAKKTEDENVADEKDRLRKAEEFLENVEAIQIIDSITVPTEGFYRSYRLMPSSGFLLPPSAIPFQESAEQATMAYSNESGELMMWAEPDSLGTMRIVESMRLTDGGWTPPAFTPEDLNGGGDADYPFLLSDGQTLYYASDGEGSLGGYDIFMTMRDPSTGEYLEPRNIGMPYNSPYDDYMFALDEETGVGWWATERASDAGKTTVYIFIPNDMRVNVDAEENEPVPFARIDNIAMTVKDKEKASELRQAVAAISPDAKPKKREEFRFPMGRGVVYTSLDDFSNSGKRMMQIYLKTLSDFEAAEKALVAERRAPIPAAQKVRALQSEVDRLRLEVKRTRNEVYRAEGRK